MSASKTALFYGDAGLSRNPQVGSPVRLRQNNQPGKVLEQKLDTSGAYLWRVKCDDGYEAWFPAEGLLPNTELS